MNNINEKLDGKTILITGGTGSFGRMMLNTLLKESVHEIRIFSRHEDLQVQMKREVQDERVKFFLGDVRDYERCLEVTKGVDIVFHAAALKHISEIERHPMEAVKTNILGTWNLKKSCIENNVNHVVGISTDKAVKPINVYGMTKAIDERILLNRETEFATKFSVVRYGNVIGSRGSVIPYWYSLAKNHQDLPITDEGMTRFWITLDEAIKLVLFALKNPFMICVKNFKAFALIDLARIYKEEFSVREKIIGIRAGEKIHECLLTDYEMRKSKLDNGYYKVDLNSKDVTRNVSDFSSDMADKIGYEEMKTLLKKEGLL
jgi:FlaA1/EpsC-like NDP-sugar epimerase